MLGLSPRLFWCGTKRPLMALDRVLLDLVLTLHLLFIAWVALGALLTRGRRWLSWLHIASLVYGVFIEIAPLPCPLTLAEQALERRLGLASYQGSFLQHYLQLWIYPNLPYALLIAAAVAVCGLNLAIYIRRARRGAFSTRS